MLGADPRRERASLRVPPARELSGPFEPGSRPVRMAIVPKFLTVVRIIGSPDTHTLGRTVDSVKARPANTASEYWTESR